MILLVLVRRSTTRRTTIILKCIVSYLRQHIDLAIILSSSLLWIVAIQSITTSLQGSPRFQFAAASCKNIYLYSMTGLIVRERMIVPRKNSAHLILAPTNLLSFYSKCVLLEFSSKVISQILQRNIYANYKERVTESLISVRFFFWLKHCCDSRQMTEDSFVLVGNDPVHPRDSHWPKT